MTGAVLTLLIDRLTPHSIGVMFGLAPTWYLGAACLLTIPNILTQVAKWRYVLRLADPAISSQTAYRSLVVGFPLGFVTPGRLGEIGRALFVKQLRQVTTFKLVILDKVSNMLIVVGAGLFAIQTHPGLHLAAVVKWGAVAGLAAVSGFLLYTCLSNGFSARLARGLQVRQVSKSQMLTVTLFSTLFFCIYLTQLVCLVNHFGDTDILPAVKAAAAVFLTKTALPIGFADLGIREGAAVFFFGKIEVVASAAFAAALWLFCLNVALPALLGLPILIKTKREL